MGASRMFDKDSDRIETKASIEEFMDQNGPFAAKTLKRMGALDIAEILGLSPYLTEESK